MDTHPIALDSRDDTYAWAIGQAGMVRAALDAGHLPAGIDWLGIIEELDALARSEVRALKSHLAVALAHLLKLACWPLHDASRQWTLSARNGLRQAQDIWRDSMVGTVDIDAIYADEVESLAIIGLDYGTALHQPATAGRLTLSEMLDARADGPGIAALAARLRAVA